MALHDFIKMSKLKDEKSFYQKYPTPDAFFKAYPKAAQGYTINQDPITEYDPYGNPINIEGATQPTPQLPQQGQKQERKGGNFAAKAAPWFGAAREVGKMFSDVIPAAMSAISGMVQEQSTTRYKPIQESYNQYAYGTGSKAMWANGGSSPLDEYLPQLMQNDAVLSNQPPQQYVDPALSLDPATSPQAQPQPIEDNTGLPAAPITIPTQTNKKYSGTFSDAFKQARKELGAGEVFTWNGKSYTTAIARESKNKKNAPTVSKVTPSQQKADTPTVRDMSWVNPNYGDASRATATIDPTNPYRTQIPDNKFTRELLGIKPINTSDANSEHSKVLAELAAMALPVGEAAGALAPRVTYEAIPVGREVMRQGAKKLLKEAPKQLKRGIKPNGFISTAGYNFEDGGSVNNKLNYNQAQQYELNNLPYKVPSNRADVPMMDNYPNMPQYANPNSVPYSSRYITQWEATPQPPQNSIDIFDRFGNKVRTEQYTGSFEDYLKSNKEKTGYGLFTTMDRTGKTAIDTRADGRGKVSKMEQGGSMYEQGKEYDLSPTEIAHLRSMGYKITVK